MKKRVLIICLFVVTFFYAQQDYNTKNGLVANGYDVTEYFNNKAIKGDPNFTSSYNGVSYQFITAANKEKFDKNPIKYIPQYGGYCAYAIGINGEKVSINPKTFEIRDGKLYLFYNSWGINTLKKWKQEGAEDLQEKADKNWAKLGSTLKH
ncbi:YHS domain-containing (seleno)protein [Aquimarina hainanensis]|uniref:YHS domain-containing (Seleno)protein n=1 Tax=Aquimarina hainanensis TaxID=1578017 RepID=A0ABW5N2X2_9FLAO|nr:YHS domain-containing (seleno)protein [Aquimarina sp. TRL1]QKX04421.1 hypothetical protein HN014_05695 [Aquimarina sp. TRL1]